MIARHRRGMAHPDQIEFLVITAAVVPDKARAMMRGFDRFVRHFEVVE